MAAAMSERTRVIQYGLGAIGRATARLVLERAGLELVGAVDCDPKVAARDLGEVLELGRELGVIVSDQPQELFDEVEADAVIHCTGSSFAGVCDQLAEIVRAELNCVTSCEEALFPYYQHRELAEELNELCVSHSVSVLGTGVNPGFVMDTLAVVSTVVCQRVDAVRVRRVVDVATRREALQRKVGAGLSKGEFESRVNEGTLGHVGLAESLVFIADALNWTLDAVDEMIEPVLAEGMLKSEFVTVPRGAAAGVHQIARGTREGREILTLDLQMSVGAPNPRDEIEIVGVPPLRLVIEGGVAGDLATPSILVNMLPQVISAVPGLHTMRTLGLPRATV